MTHKFTIEIELEDGQFCDGCPCRYFTEHGGSPECTNEELFMLGKSLEYDKGIKTKRPQVCIDRYGPEGL